MAAAFYRGGGEVEQTYFWIGCHPGFLKKVHGFLNGFSGLKLGFLEQVFAKICVSGTELWSISATNRL